jgi:hypothetical protein
MRDIPLAEYYYVIGDSWCKWTLSFENDELQMDEQGQHSDHAAMHACRGSMSNVVTIANAEDGCDGAGILAFSYRVQGLLIFDFDAALPKLQLCCGPGWD